MYLCQLTLMLSVAPYNALQLIMKAVQTMPSPCREGQSNDDNAETGYKTIAKNGNAEQAACVGTLISTTANDEASPLDLASGCQEAVCHGQKSPPQVVRKRPPTEILTHPPQGMVTTP